MISLSSSRVSARALGASLLVASAALTAGVARAEVRHDGDWDDDKEVTLDLDRVTRGEAVKRLAQATGWSIVFDAPPGDAIDVHVKDQSAIKVLDILLEDGHAYVAKRDDSLIFIKRADDAAQVTVNPVNPVIPPIPPIPPIRPFFPHPPASLDDPEEQGTDRVVTGGNLRIEEDEVAADVTVMGGNVDIFGKATGDVVAMGGGVRIHKGAHVFGDATAVGGTLSIEDGARVDGDVGVLGGVLRRGKDAEIRGDIKDGHKHKHGHRNKHRDRDRDHDASDASDAPDAKVQSVSTLRRVAREAGNALTQTALLFVFGAVLTSLAAPRMEALKLQLATRPMRSFATGVVTLLLSAVLLVALCVTLIGIPFAFIGVLLGFMAACAGLVAALETIGGALLAHKTKNSYVHLAFGCLLFMLVGAVPFVGTFLTVALILAGIGSVAATRGAGLIPTKNRPTGTPYRDAALG
jgi:hypothetical protein